LFGTGPVRRVATAAVLGGTTVTLASGAFWGVLLTEAKLARRWVGSPTSDPPDDQGTYGFCEGSPISFAILGDSSAAGLGCDHGYETPGARIAAGLAAVAEVPVQLTNVARVGAVSGDLAGRVERALAARPEVALIMIGTNDITHRVRPSLAVAQLGAAVKELRANGCQVVVGTCPDLGTIEPLAPPLKQYARLLSRRLAQAQARAVVECDGRAVALGSILADEFTSFSELLFGPDRFHPSAAGYARMTSAVLPTALAALGLSEDEVPESVRGERVLPLAEAVHEAAQHPGASVEPLASTAGAGDRRRFALLRRRRHQPQAEVTAPRETEGTEEPRAAAGADHGDDRQT
jgi:lysophospholipase L1-like esterase